MKTTMKRSAPALLLALVLLLSLIPLPAHAAGLTPAASDNHGANDYLLWSSPMDSYLFENGSGGVTRVEYIDGTIVVENYDASFRQTSASTLPMELETFGGFYAGADYNFFLFGQSNPDEDDGREVFRVVEYSKDWKRLGSASLSGANTTVPFDAGSARFAEAGGYLYIRTCHEMYMTSDGLNHQANVMLVVRERDVTLTDSVYQIRNVNAGYVSHSFNQFILANRAGDLITLDHGDAGDTRSAVLCRYPGLAGKADLNTDYWWGTGLPRVDLAVFPSAADQRNYNFTGAALGGLEETSSGYLAALSVDDLDGAVSSIRNVAVISVGASLSGAPQLTRLTTQYSGAESSGTRTVSAPQLVKFSDDRFLVLWEVTQRKTDWIYDASVPTGELNYVFVNAAGKAVSEQFSAEGGLSDCRPIVTGGRAVWYTTFGGAPTFYTVDESGAFSAVRTAATFSDLPLNHWASSYVESMVARKVVNGYTDGTFRPDAPVTLAEFSKMMCVAFYEDAPGWTPWWYGYLYNVNRHGLLDGIGMNVGIRFDAGQYSEETEVNNAMTRYDMAQMMYNYLLDKNAALPDAAARQAATAAIGDWDQIPEQYRTAVSVCYAMELLKGSGGIFNGKGSMSRDAACTVLYRLLNAV